MKNKVLKVIILLIIITLICFAIYYFISNSKFNRKKFIKDVQDLYVQLLKKEDNISSNLKYKYYFNNKGELVLLVAHNDKYRIRLGSINNIEPIKKEDISLDKIEDNSIIRINVNYRVVGSGTNNNYSVKGFFINDKNNVVISSGAKNELMMLKIYDVYIENEECTIIVSEEKKEDNKYIQDTYFSYIEIELKNNKEKINKYIVKDLYNDNYNEIEPIIIEKNNE